MRQSLGGTDRLSQDGLPQLRLQGSGRNEVNSSAQNLLEKPAQAHELEEADRNAELDEQVHVAFSASFASRNRPEYGKCLDVKSIQRLTLRRDFR
jgi:hypothetical protein